MDKIKTVWSPAVGSNWNDFKNWILTDVKRIFQEELNFNIKEIEDSDSKNFIIYKNDESTGIYFHTNNSSREIYINIYANGEIQTNYKLDFSFTNDTYYVPFNYCYSGDTICFGFATGGYTSSSDGRFLPQCQFICSLATNIETDEQKYCYHISRNSSRGNTGLYYNFAIENESTILTTNNYLYNYFIIPKALSCAPLILNGNNTYKIEKVYLPIIKPEPTFQYSKIYNCGNKNYLSIYSSRDASNNYDLLFIDVT